MESRAVINSVFVNKCDENQFRFFSERYSRYFKMSSNLKCTGCGSTDIDVDPSRADAVCTNCGNVLESSIIVSDIQFEENAHGGSSAIGTFVSSESKGGASFSFGGGSGRGFAQFQGGLVRESREITLRNARRKIEALAQQLSLRRDRIDMAFHFFKLALNKHLTRGRPSTHVIAACVYITCRTESTPHMLIDFSDVLQIDVYALGRTYLRLSQALCINIPAMDPCLYVLRFAHRLELDDKTHEVSMTALRLVSRMKKDWIHFGRRPSGLCGAALLIAARMHGFNRSVYDIIKVVKVHESTLRKRLNEFGETPTSQLTLEEFNNIDLDAMTEEQDPPSFKAARKRDRERLLKLEEDDEVDDEFNDLEEKIEKALDDVRLKMKKKGPFAKMHKEAIEDRQKNREQKQEKGNSSEDVEAEEFITAETLGAIDAIVNEPNEQLDSLLMPPPGSKSAPTVGLGLKDSIQDYLVSADQPVQEPVKEIEESDELDLNGIDDSEIDGYIMTDKEIEFKTQMWHRINAEYLKEQAEKAERERKEAEEAEKEGREIKKKPRRTKKQKLETKPGGHSTAIEAIEKIVAEKKISTKINYDVLKSLNSPSPMPASPSPSIGPDSPYSPASPNPNAVFTPSLNSPMRRLTSFRKDRDLSLNKKSPGSPLTNNKKSLNSPSPSPKRARLLSNSSDVSNVSSPASPQKAVVIESGPIVPEEEEEDFSDHEEHEEKVLSAKELLSQHMGAEYGHDEYEEEEYF